MDPRAERLAEILIGFSTRCAKGDRLLIEAENESDELLIALIRKAYRAGAVPHVILRSSRVERELAMGYTEKQLSLQAKLDAMLMEETDAYIYYCAIGNDSEMSDVPQEKMELFARLYDDPVHGRIRIPKTRWCVLRYPTQAMAQAASMSTERFRDFYYDVCTLDYSKMDEAMRPLKELMEKTDSVRITGSGTDISFSIKGMPAVPCAGRCNLPDGEIYTAPVRESVNGFITYNTPSLMNGFCFENVRLEFQNGRIIAAEANDTARVDQMLDVDAGARYVGEFALGVNPYIKRPMRNTLFDEKIMGSFHLTPGMSYSNCDNGNHSALHWDLVCIQTPEYGGGEIWFDDKLIRKDGRFVPESLQGLNPENLI